MCCSLDSLVYFLTFYFYIKDAGRCRSGACICIMPHISHWFSILIGNNFSVWRGASRGLKKSMHAYIAARFPIGYKHSYEEGLRGLILIHTLCYIFLLTPVFEKSENYFLQQKIWKIKLQMKMEWCFWGIKEG